MLTSTADTTFVDFAAALREAVPTGPHLVTLRGPATHGLVSREQFLVGRDRDVPRPAPRSTALVIYTSGTTANPKGCMLSHESITRGPSERAAQRLQSSDHEVTWAAGPLFHIGSLGPFIGSIGVAGTFLADVVFDAGRALALMAEHRVTVAWPWFSAIVQSLLDHPTFEPTHFASMRYLFIIAPPPLVLRTIAAFPSAEVLQACGMTETAGIFALSDRDETEDVRSLTQGKAWLGVSVKIRKLAESDAVGEILVRGPCVMTGYYRDAARTAEALDADGWLHTGDLYAQRDDGSLIFNGRLKDMLKVGGENVAALEVEQLLCSHPAVRLAEVVGRPDARFDEVPVAFVELKSAATEAELIDHCRGKLASFKLPRAIIFVAADEWPMSATKVDKRALRARLG